ncbi:hypothetical protein Drorol1_Dr00011143 [Drosera rotundifolia]
MAQPMSWILLILEIDRKVDWSSGTKARRPHLQLSWHCHLLIGRKWKDKASVFAEAIRRLRELNRIAANIRSSVVGRSATLTRLQASSISTYIGGLLLPDATDGVSVHPSKADSSIVIATLSCEGREIVIPEITRAARLQREG